MKSAAFAGALGRDPLYAALSEQIVIAYGNAVGAYRQQFRSAVFGSSCHRGVETIIPPHFSAGSAAGASSILGLIARAGSESDIP